MQPWTCKSHQKLNSIWIWRVGYLLAMEFDLMNGRINQLLINAFINEIRERFKYKGLDFLGSAFFNIL